MAKTRLRGLAATAVGALLVAGASAPSAAGTPEYGEYQMKAAFIKNFVKFVAWPSRPSGTLTLCILGADPFGSELQGRDDAGGGRSLAYRRIGGLQDAGDCQILFVTRGAKTDPSQILPALAGREVLTIGESEGSARSGLMIGFLVEERKIRFEANLGPARGAGLAISAKLLGLAKTVYNPR